MKFTLDRDVIISFLSSAVSGICLDTFTYHDSKSLIAFSAFCFGLIPFLGCVLHEKKGVRFAGFLGFSLPVSFLAGEGLWHSLYAYYHVSLTLSVLVFTGWVWLAGCLQWFILSLLCRGWLCTKPDSLWLFPFAWMAMEFVYGKISIQGLSIDMGLLGPLNSIGKIFVKAGGVHALSFFYVCVNIFFFALIHPVWRKGILKKGWATTLIFLFVMSLAGVLSGRKEKVLDKPLHAALIQPNLAIWRQTKSDRTAQQRLEKLTDMTRTALAEKPDLIVWPAAALNIRDNSEIFYALKLLGEKNIPESKILLGVLRVVRDHAQEKMQNTVYLVNTLGEIENIYIKQKLTPYTEYIPCAFLDFIGRKKEGILPFLSSPENGPVFETGKARWGNLVCIEIYYPGLLRTYVRNGADFLVHFSNDDAFGETRFKRLLVKLSALRAVETGLSILRESITGISAFINSEGEILDYLPSGQEGIVYATLARKSQGTFYASFGDIFSYISLCVTMWGIWNSRRQKK